MIVRALVVVVLLIALVLGLAAVFAWKHYQEFVMTPLTVPADGAVLLLEPGMTGRDAVARLEREGYTDGNWRWRVLMRQHPLLLKAGEYRLTPGLTPLELLHKLNRGEVIQRQFTIVEGWTFRQLVTALEAAGLLHLAEGARPQEAALQLMARPPEPPEGWFLPETYAYVRGDNAGVILQRAHDAMLGELDQAWSDRVAGHPARTPYELLILASIVEKETAIESERAAISGVFVRRLLAGMRLQTDPTVIYGLGEAFDGDLRRSDLQTDTPYNTYTRHGLPPTPIALPGRASLQAAARPAEGEYLYFVANGLGGHTFSTTLQEHEAAVRALIRMQSVR